MKKLIALLMAVVMVLALCACGNTNTSTPADGDKNAAAGDYKIGVILLHDENVGYDAAHMNGVKAAMATLGIPEDKVIFKTSIPEDETCYETAADLAGQGCTAVFSDSFGHQSYMVQAAEEYPEVVFLPATGDTAAVCGLPNVKNFFNHTFESRYVSGVVAGMKLAELIEDGKLTNANFDADGNALVGYVGAYPYAEVVSGYTAFYLGVKSIVENVSMLVNYTNSWADSTAEDAAANALMAKGCSIISQHADTTGAPSAIQAAKDGGSVVYSVGYNIDMLTAAPTAALTSAQNDWAVYYTYAMGLIVEGKGMDIDTDWSKGYADGANMISELGPECAEGTAEKVAEVEAAIKDGTLKVFDTTTFTVAGAPVDTYTFNSSTMNSDYSAVLYEGKDYECIVDGAFMESSFRSAPYFDLRIDGIVELG